MIDNKKIIITGISGQDGSYLAESLLEKGYSVFGTVRKSFNGFNDDRKHIEKDAVIDVINYESPNDIQNLINMVKPHEIYNLSALASSSKVSTSTIDHSKINLLFPLYILDHTRVNIHKPRLFFALSSEIFGNPRVTPQNEMTPNNPVNPYGFSKSNLSLHVQYYREKHGVFCCSGILFNHESPKRRIEHVTRKITQAVAKIKLGLQSKVMLGDLNSVRDWSHAKDFVRAFQMILNHKQPHDFVLASGIGRTVKELCRISFGCVGLDYHQFVEVDPIFLRKEKGRERVGNTAKAKSLLNWETQISFEDLIKEMIYSDMRNEQDKIKG